MYLDKAWLQGPRYDLLYGVPVIVRPDQCGVCSHGRWQLTWETPPGMVTDRRNPMLLVCDDHLAEFKRAVDLDEWDGKQDLRHGIRDLDPR